MSSKSAPREKLRWQIHTVGWEGFMFGLDAVTPVVWKVIRSRKDPDAYYYSDLRDPDIAAYRDWLRRHRNREVFASVIELRRLFATLRLPPPPSVTQAAG